MSSASRAAPVAPLAETVVSPQCCLADASLAGTCGNLLGLRLLPVRARSRRSSLEGKPLNLQTVRKSVSFSLRARGPGPAYSSPSPDQLQSSGPRCREQQTPPQQDAPAGPANADVVRRLFRAVQGHASSPEPQPKAYPGWVPQPQQTKPNGLPPQPQAFERDWQPAANPAIAASGGPGHPNDDAKWVSRAPSGPAVDGDAGASAVALDAQALARLRLAISCAGALGAPATTLHTFLAAPMDRNVRLQSPSGSTQCRGAWMAPHRVQPIGAHAQPPLASAAQRPYQSYVATADKLPAQAQGDSGHVLPPSGPGSTEVSAATGWAAPPARPLDRELLRVLPSVQSHDPHNPVGETATAIGRFEGAAPAVGFSTLPATAATITARSAAAASTSRAAPPLAAASAPAGRKAAKTASSPADDDAQPYATFEQVHLMLASLNLPGTKAFGQPHENTEAEQLGQSGNLGPAAASSSRQESERLPADGLQASQRGVLSGNGAVGGPGTSLVSTPRRSVSWHAGVPGEPDTDTTAAASSGTPVRGTAVQDAALDAARWRFERTLASRSPGGPRAHTAAPTGGSGSQDWFTEALRPACLAWLRAVGGVVTQQRHVGGEELSDLAQQLREALVERRQVEAYLLGTRLGLPRGRLARLHDLAAASGAPPAMTAGLLSQLEARLRLKVALGALRRHAAVRARTWDLLRSREEPGGPLGAAAWQCWRRAAAARLALRGRVDAMAAARRRLFTARILLAWHAAVERTAALRQLGVDLQKRVSRSRLAQSLRAWHSAGARCAALRRAEQACRVAWTRRLLTEWHSTTQRVAHSGRLRRTAERHHRSRLLLASLAHWRFLYVSGAVSRAWESALSRRRALQLLARAMRVWHFYARRCRQLIRQLAGQRAAAAAGAMPLVDEAALPAPLTLSAVPGKIRRLLTTARGFMLAMSDELLHLRSLLRFSVAAAVRTKPAAAAGVQTPAGLSRGAYHGSSRPQAPEASGASSNAIAPDDGRARLSGLTEGEEQTSALKTARLSGFPAAGATGKQRTSPRLLISGQWRHKHQVLVLLAQLRQVERLAADVDAQLEAAERDGRMVRLELQQRADEIQRRTAASRDEMAAAALQQQAVHAEMEQLDKETRAVGGYLDLCRVASAAAAEQLHGMEELLREAEAQRQRARAAASEAQEREASLRCDHQARQAAADEAARACPHPSFARAQEAERQGRERLLASQRRLSEALQLKAALMAHWRETQVAAASAPRYAAQRHALRVAEAQQQVVEAAKVVSLAELEVQDLLSAVGRLAQATQDARGADHEVQAAADSAAALAVEAAAGAAAAAREAQEEAAAEARAQDAVLALRVQLQQLREAQAAELPQTPSAQQTVLLGPLRAREAQMKAQLEESRERAEAAHGELQAALADATELSQQVEAAEVAYRAQLLRLQPARAKLQQSVVQLRSRLEAYPSELVRQLRRLVEEHGIEACQDAAGKWTVQNLPPEWKHGLRAGLLLPEADAASDDEASGAPTIPQRVAVMRDALRPLSSQQGGSSSPPPAVRVHSFSGWVLSDAASSSVQPMPSDGVATGANAAADASVTAAITTAVAVPGMGAATAVTPGEPHGLSLSPQLGPTLGLPSPALHQYPHQHQHQRLNLDLDLHSMTAAQLSRVARSVLGSPVLRSVEARLDESPTRSARRGDGFMAAAAAATAEAAEIERSSSGPSYGVRRLGLRTRHSASPRSVVQPSQLAPTALAPLWDTGYAGQGPVAQPQHPLDMGRDPNSQDVVPDGTLGRLEAASLEIPSGAPSPAEVMPAARRPGLHARRQLEQQTQTQAHVPVSAIVQHAASGADGSVGGQVRLDAPSRSLAAAGAVQDQQQHWQQQQQQQQFGSSCGHGGHSGPAHAAPAAAALSPETRRLISLLEQEMGWSIGQAGGNSSAATTGGEGHTSYGGGSWSGAELDAAAAAPLQGRRVLSSGCGSDDFHRDERPMGSHLPPPAALPTPLYGPPEPFLGSSASAQAAPGQQRIADGDCGAPGEGDLALEMMRRSVLGGARSGSAVEGAEGRFSSASSIYAHFSDPQNLMVPGDLAPAAAARYVPEKAGAERASEQPRHTHADLDEQLQAQLQLWRQQQQSSEPLALREDDAKVARISEVEVTVRRPEHLNCEAPTAAAGDLRGRRATDPACGSTMQPIRLEDAADRFYRRRLCHRTLQGFRQYAANLDWLATRICRVACAARLRWALADWREGARRPYQLAERAGRAGACQRCLRRWRAYACDRRRRASALELGLQRGRYRKLGSCLAAWRVWCDRQVSKRRAVARACQHHLGCLLLRWRLAAHESREGKARDALASTFYHRGLCRRCLEQWVRTCRARQLLRRVFALAELLWDERTEPSSCFGGEFGILRRAFDQLSRYRVYRLDKRRERINEEAAVAFRTSLLRVRVFAAWQGAVASASHDRYIRRVVARLLRAWRRLAHERRDLPTSLCNLRRRLREWGYAAGEIDVRRRWLLRCALVALGSASAESWRHYARSLLSRALSSWLLVHAESAAIVQAREDRWRRTLLRHWQAITAGNARLRHACAALEEQNRRRLLRRSLQVWALFLERARAKGRLLCTAAQHYARNLALRVLRRLSDYSSAAWTRAAAQDASRRLYCCMALWRAQVLATRAKTDALQRTLMALDASKPLMPDEPPQYAAQATTTIVGALLPTGSQPASHRVDCVSTVLPMNTMDVERAPVQPQSRNHSSTTVRDEMSSCSYRMVRGPDGRVAEVLVLEHRSPWAQTPWADPSVSPSASESQMVPQGTQGRHGAPSKFDVSDKSCGSEATTHGGLQDNRHPDSSVSAPSQVNLHDLPSDVSSMDASTLEMWRQYAQNQLADEWRRQQLLKRSMSGWRRCVAKSSFMKRWKLRKDSSSSHKGR